MTGEARILSAFWQRNQGRFCELVASEIKHKSGLDPHSDPFKMLEAKGMIRNTTLGGSPKLYSLTRDGEAAVTAMIVIGTLPKPVFGLTAIPPKVKKRR